MSAFVIGLLHASSEVMWAMIGKLVTRAFLEKLMTKLVIAGLKKLAQNTNNQLDDSIVADVEKALTGDQSL